MYEFEFKIESDKEIIDYLNGHLILHIDGYGCPINKPNLFEVAKLIKGLYHLDTKTDKVLITEVSKYYNSIGNIVTEDWMEEEDYQRLVDNNY